MVVEAFNEYITSKQEDIKENFYKCFCLSEKFREYYLDKTSFLFIYDSYKIWETFKNIIIVNMIEKLYRILILENRILDLENITRGPYLNLDEKIVALNIVPSSILSRSVYDLFLSIEEARTIESTIEEYVNNFIKTEDLVILEVTIKGNYYAV